LLQVGAVGLGTILTIILTSTAADLTGLLAAGAIAALGLFVIPSKRRQAKKELRQKSEDMRHRLIAALTTQFERELDLSVKRIDQAVAPYTRFIRAEREKLERTQRELTEVDEAMCLLKGQVDGLIQGHSEYST
jgi:ABC-type transport system involved in cytochrome bd biosynthesis fused ATPase/permease subunit